MRDTTFQRRLEEAKANNLTYTREGLDGLISVWKLDNKYILTWEECPPGQQYDESTYTRDEKHEFGSYQQLIDFLVTNGFHVDQFTP